MFMSLCKAVGHTLYLACTSSCADSTLLHVHLVRTSSKCHGHTHASSSPSQYEDAYVIWNNGRGLMKMTRRTLSVDDGGWVFWLHFITALITVRYAETQKCSPPLFWDIFHWPLSTERTWCVSVAFFFKRVFIFFYSLSWNLFTLNLTHTHTHFQGGTLSLCTAYGWEICVIFFFFPGQSGIL